jgi:hypothetical protein
MALAQYPAYGDTESIQLKGKRKKGCSKNHEKDVIVNISKCLQQNSDF